MAVRKKKKRRPSIWAPMTPAQMQSEADRRVNQALVPQQDALRAMSQAVAGILQTRAPQVQQGYSNAAGAIAGYGQGFAGEVRGRLEAAQQAASEFGALAGVPTQAPALDPDAVQNATYAPAFTASGSLEEQGAAAGALAAAQPGIHAAATTDQLRAIAAQRPELRSKILEELYNREIQKAQMRIQMDAQNLYERQFGLEKAKLGEERRQFNISARLEAIGLSIRDRQSRASVARAYAQGREVDASASRLLGYLVDQHGRPIMRGGRRIRITDKVTQKDRRKAYREAVGEARDLYGDPITNSDVSPLRPGRYIARPGARGVFPPSGPGGVATTNDPRKARHDTEKTWAQAMKFLRNRYGISRNAARRALIAAGWPAPRRRIPTEGSPADNPGVG